MPPPSGAWVNAYQRIVATVGGFLKSREVLWFDPNTFATSDNPTEGRTEVRAASTGLFPPSGHAFEPGDIAGAGGATVLVLASMDGPTHVGSVSLIPLDTLTANDTNYIIVDIRDISDLGSPVGSSLFTGTTKITGTNASGDWTTGVPVWEAGLSYDLAAGHRLIAQWSFGGVGVARPPGAWRYT